MSNPVDAVTAPEALRIRGGRPLQGVAEIHPAKNAALPLILASLLTADPVELVDVPDLSDVRIAGQILEHIGVDVRRESDGTLRLHAARVSTCGAPYRLVSRMRASFIAMGALLARCGEARISMPGGCAFGPRPVDRHIRAFRDLGATIAEEGGDFLATRDGPLEGTVRFEAPTVGGTQNVLLASALGTGTVVVENAALEPEVVDLVRMLRAMGAQIEGEGTRTLTIHGVPKLNGVRYRPIPDRIEAGTFLLAAAATRGTIRLRAVEPEHLVAVLDLLRESGCRVEHVDATTIDLDASGHLRPVDVTAREYPGVPTDLQAPLGAFLATVEGVARVEDTIYPTRFTHVDELKRHGAHVDLDDDGLVVRGAPLHGAVTHAPDLRAGGALVVAALAAHGESVVTGLEHVDRGYHDLAGRLARLGADVARIADPDLSHVAVGD